MVEGHDGRIKDTRRFGMLALLEALELLGNLVELAVALTDGWNGRQ